MWEGGKEGGREEGERCRRGWKEEGGREEGGREDEEGGREGGTKERGGGQKQQFTFTHNSHELKYQRHYYHETLTSFIFV